MTTDALGRQVALRRRPRRIVSLVPSLSEALFAFGLDDEVVGVTHFCLEPRAKTARKEKVGGTKTLDVAKVLSLAPDLVVASAEENRREDLERLIASGLVIYVTLPTTVGGAIAMLRDLAALTGAGAEATAVVTGAEAALAAAPAATAGRTPVPVFCPVWRQPYMTINRHTYVHDVIAVCGGRNIFAHCQERYPTVNLAEMAHLDPHVILLPSEPYRFRERHLADFAPYRHVTALRNGHVYLVDGRMLCWYGPRMAQSLWTLTDLLQRRPRYDYPEKL
ncbi:MAG: cobalamin-binding protein [Dehalococcoidia bacterium]